MKRFENLENEEIINIKNDLTYGVSYNKEVSRGYNVKHYIEAFYGYISGDNTHELMNELGIKGDRWTHNISKKSFKELISKKIETSDYLDDYYLAQLLGGEYHEKRWQVELRNRKKRRD